MAARQTRLQESNDAFSMAEPNRTLWERNDAARCLNLAAFNATHFQRNPFDHVVVENVIDRQQLDAILAAFPDVPGSGSHVPASLNIREPFATLLRDLEGDAFRAAMERKFAVDLTRKPTVSTIRGELRAGDGTIHT